MPAPSTAGTRRPALSAERVVRAGLDLADRLGVEALTIRRLADELGVKPMTIYHHVPSKEAILDGMVDLVFAELYAPEPDRNWRDELRRRALSVRAALRRHPWAPPLMESRTTPGPQTLAHHEAVLACLRSGGLSLQLTAHAAAVLDSYLYGFALQEANLPFGGGEQLGELAESIVEAMAPDAYPRMAEFTREHVMRPGYSFGASFDFGLDMLLDGLANAAAKER